MCEFIGLFFGRKIMALDFDMFTSSRLTSDQAASFSNNVFERENKSVDSPDKKNTCIIGVDYEVSIGFHVYNIINIQVKQ